MVTFQPDILSIVILVSVSLVIAAIHDYRSRKVPVSDWRIAVFAGIPFSFVVFLLKLFSGEIIFGYVIILAGSAVVFIAFAIIFGYAGIFGGADSIALSIIALSSFYFIYPDLFIVTYVVVLIMVSISIPVITVFKNLISNNYKTLDMRHLGFLVFGTMMPVEKFNTYHGVVLEDIIVYDDGDIETRFREITTKMDESHLTTYISKNADLYNIYARVEKVWVMWILPFIIPITIAYFITVLLYILQIRIPYL